MAIVKKHSNNFNLLRRVAAFLVLYAHAITVNGNEEFLYIFLHRRIELSSLGVDIFFIISGYLVTKSLLETTTRMHFAKKRLLRLWPALVIVTLLLCFVMGPMVTTLSPSVYFSQQQTWYFFLRNIFFLPVYILPGVFNGQPVNSTFWTLFYEIICYVVLLVAGKYFLFKYRRLFTFFWISVIIFKYFFTGVITWSAFIQPHLYGISNMVFLFFTAAIWHLNTWDKKLPAKAIYRAALFLFLVITILPLPPSFRCLQQLSLLLFIIEWGRSTPLIKWPGWDISYGVYLMGFSVEMLVVHYFSPLQVPAFMVFVLTLLFTIPLAFGIWYGIEKPALKLK